MDWKCEKCGSTKKGKYAEVCNFCYYQEYNPAYYQKNKDNIKEQHKTYYASCPDVIKERTKKYYNLNRNDMREANRIWVRNHPERIREIARLSAKVNRPRIYKYQKSWIKAHPEFSQRKYNMRRSMLMGGGGSYTTEEWIKLRDSTGGVCPCCKTYVGVEKLSLDHIIPVAKKGSSYIENIQPLCKPCNSKKGTGIIDYRGNFEVKPCCVSF